MLILWNMRVLVRGGESCGTPAQGGSTRGWVHQGGGGGGPVSGRIYPDYFFKNVNIPSSENYENITININRTNLRSSYAGGKIILWNTEKFVHQHKPTIMA